MIRTSCDALALPNVPISDEEGFFLRDSLMLRILDMRAIDAIEAIHNQPRTTDEAREELDHHMDQFAALSDGLIAKLELLDAPNKDEDEDRMEILLLNAIRCGYGLDEIAATANRRPVSRLRRKKAAQPEAA